MPKTRDPIIYSKEMDALMAAEDKEDADYEERKKKKPSTPKTATTNGSFAFRIILVFQGLSIPNQPKKKPPMTAKQRLASKLGLLKK